MPIPRDVFKKAEPVPYDDIRGQIQNGDILLCNGTEVFSRLIQFATWSPWSHVGFIFKLDPIDRVMVLESVEKAGVRALALSILIKGNGRTRQPYKGRLAIARHADFANTVDFDKLRRMSQFAVDRFASPYAAIEVMKIAVRVLWAGAKLKVPGPLAKRNEYICSEYAAACYEAIELPIPGDRRGFIAPAHFAMHPKVNLVGVVETVNNKAKRAAQSAAPPPQPAPAAAPAQAAASTPAPS